MEVAGTGVNPTFKTPLLLVAGCFALGIALVRLNPPTPVEVSLLLVAAGACLFAGLVALRAGGRRVSALLAVSGFILAGAAAAALFELRFAPNHIRQVAEWGVDADETVQLEGMIVTTPLHTPYGDQFDLEAWRLLGRGRVRSVAGKVRLHLSVAADDREAAPPGGAGSLQLQYGDSIRVKVRLRRPHVYRNPGGFDYARYMESIEDLWWEGTIRSPALVERSPAKTPAAGRSYDPASLLLATRNRLLQSIDRLYPPWSAQGRDGAVLKAVLLGERSSLDSDTLEGFRRSGLYHLLVIAGLHVGLLAMLAELALRTLRLGEFTRSILVLAFLLGYALLVEQRAPTLRATLMIAAYLLARFLYRQHAALNAVGLAALMLLLARPPWLFESGFQLSFSAALLIGGLAGPILARTTEPYRSALVQIHAVDRDPSLAPRLAQFRLDVRSLIGALKGLLAVLDRHPAVADALVIGPARALIWALNVVLFSAILQVGLLLPMVEIFHRVTLAGIALNALAIPLMTALLTVAVPTVVLAATVPPLGLWAGKLVTMVLGGLFSLTELPHLPVWLSYRVPGPPAWVAWGFALSALGVAFFLSQESDLKVCATTAWSRLAGFGAWAAAGAVFATLLCLHPFAPRLPRGVVEVTALDCGGGDALLVVLPDQTTMLFGACGGRGAPNRGAAEKRRWDPGENIVSPYLWWRGLERIDVLVLADARADHLAGFSALVENFRVGEFWHGEVPPTPAYDELTQSLRQRGVRVRRVTSGDVMARGSTSVQILWPPSASGSGGASPWSRNTNPDDAVVVRIADGESTLLLPGDISSEAEQKLVNSRTLLAGRVLKVAHQGAKSFSSPEFLARVSPQVALVSGEGPPRATSRSLPNPETLARLHAVGARVFRPDIDGTVTVEMKGASLSARTYVGGKQ
jgi:competence protein ComEC